jgi:hypothetical protein
MSATAGDAYGFYPRGPRAAGADVHHFDHLYLFG